uniref:ORF1a protein n=1 Tax=Macaque MLB-like astrovirus TaxID=2796356 RepID=A0A8E0KGF6_9VIRU|nr:TPA: ORF1a protein [Macaque MLB-like astrovirus]
MASLNISDKIMLLGSERSRKALDLQPDHVLAELVLKFPESPVVTSLVPRARHRLGAGVTLMVQGMTSVGVYTSYVLHNEKWLEVEEDRVHSVCAYVGSLVLDRKILQQQLNEAQQHCSQLMMEHELLRHDVERYRPAPPRKFTNTALFVLFFFLFFIIGTKAESWQDELRDQVNGAAREFEEMVMVHHDYILSSLVSLICWEVVSCVIAIYSFFKMKRPVIAIIGLFLATLSHYNYAALTITPYLDAYSVGFLYSMMIISFIVPHVAVLTSLVSFSIFAIVSMIFTNVTFYQRVRGDFLVVVVTIATYVCQIFQIPTTIVAIVMASYRVYSMMTVPNGATVEIKDVTGKVVSKEAVLPNWLGKMYQAATKLMHQKVRTGVSQFVRINPDCLCHVKNENLMGTGFRLGNDIVTAAHVVGSAVSVEVIYNNYVAQAKVRHVPDKDIAYLVLPEGLKNMPVLKLAKKPEYDQVTIIALDGVNVLVSVTEGVCHGETISYACATRDGMSGAPVLDKNGHVLGVHQTNTGYTGGAVVIRAIDAAPYVDENTALKKEIEELKKIIQDMNQSKKSDDIVNLVRAAVQREISVLRDEVNANLLQKKKGKNKHGRGARIHVKRGQKFLTEEEYQELLDKGLSREQLLSAVDELIRQRVGFPEWSDPEYSDTDDDEDAREQWWEQVDEKDYNDGVPQYDHIKPKYSPIERVFTPDEKKIEEYIVLQNLVDSITKEKWEAEKDSLTKQLNTSLYKLDCKLAQSGKLLFDQRIRPKNVKRGSRKRAQN